MSGNILAIIRDRAWVFVISVGKPVHPKIVILLILSSIWRDGIPRFLKMMMNIGRAVRRRKILSNSEIQVTKMRNSYSIKILFKAVSSRRLKLIDLKYLIFSSWIKYQIKHTANYAMKSSRWEIRNIRNWRITWIRNILMY